MQKNSRLVESLSLHSAVSRQIFIDCTRYLLPLFAVSCGINFLFLASPIYMLQVYDRVLGSGSMATLSFLALIAVFCFALMGCLDFVRSRSLNFLGAFVFSRNAPVVLELSALQAAKSGHSTTIGLREMDVIRGFVSGGAANTLLDAPCTPLFLIAIFAIHPLMGLVTAAGGVVLFLIAYWSDRRTRSTAEASHNDETRAFEFASEICDGADYLVATGRMSRIGHAYSAVVDRQLRMQLSTSETNSYALSLSKFLRLVLQVIILGTGAYLVVDGRLSAGAMVASSIITSRALAPIEQSIGAWHQFQAARRALVMIGQLELFRPTERPKFDLQAPRGAVRLDRVGFRLAGAQRPILWNLTFEAQPGELMAIVGESGTGKTTLCRLLTGLVLPTSGKFLIDGIEFSSWGGLQLETLVGYLPQSPKFLYGTIAQNIANFDPDATDEKIVLAARQCGAHEVITQLPQAYSTIIGPRGASLSGGQSQLIALARALFPDPRILILDEPTAHLDQAAKSRFGAFLKRCTLMQKTVILVTHDQHLARASDAAIILHQDRYELKRNMDRSLSRDALSDAAIASTHSASSVI